MNGIDVSSHQGTIDWSKIKVDFAIIRLGYGDNLESQDDKYFLRNVNGCISNNIPFGVYLYSYAKNESGSESIESEILHTKRMLSKISKKPFCVYIDMEDSSTTHLGKNTLTNYAIKYCEEINNLGYKSGVYANENWFKNYLDISKISGNGYSIWCAKYSDNLPNISSNYDIWQYSDSGTIDGINGKVDMNTMYNDIRNNNNTKNNTSTNSQVNVYYRVKTKNYNWLPEIKNLEDYAGYKNDPISAIAIKTNIGNVKYRVHIKNKKWLSYVTGYDTSDINNGYAGDGKNIIDAIEVYYYTPTDIRPYKRAKYKINNYDWQYDNETKNNQDGYAGKLGVSAVKFQIIIE